MPEYFDITDENDKIVDRAERQEAHKKRLWHRAVYVFVFNSKGELFLQQRSDDKDTEKGLWTCSASGHPTSGQGCTEAATRETEEEIGVKVAPKEILSMKYPPYGHHLRIFRAEHDGPFRLDPSEVKAGRFVSMDELRKEIDDSPGRFSPEFIAVLEKVSRSLSP